MSVAKFSVGRSGAGGANAEYITREKAAEKIEFHNLKKLEAETKEEARTNAIAYAHTREDSELAKSKNGRTHYRLLLTFDRKEESEKVVEESKEFLENNLPKARAIIAVHQDTDYTHAHVWIDARQTDGKKIHLGYKTFRTLDERWTEQFDKSYGTNYAAQYKAKKQETKDWKDRKRQWKDFYVRSGDGDKNLPLPTKPQRAADIFDPKHWREKEITNLGVNNKKDEKIRLGTDQSNSPTRNRFIERAESLNSGAESEFQSTSSADSDGIQTSRKGNDLALPNSQTNSGEGQTNADNHYGNQDQHIYGTVLHDIYYNVSGLTATESDYQKNTEEYFSQSRLREYAGDQGKFQGEISESISGVANYGAADVEIFKLPQIELIEPNFNLNAEAFIKDIMQMINQNLEEQNRQMSDRAQELYKNHLNTAATVPPVQPQIDYVSQFNAVQKSEDNKINLEGTSKLETIHAIISNADEDERHKLAKGVADIFEKKAEKEKKEELHDEQNEMLVESRGMSM